MAAGGRRVPDAAARVGPAGRLAGRGLRRARDAQRGRDRRGALPRLPRLGPRHRGAPGAPCGPTRPGWSPSGSRTARSPGSRPPSPRSTSASLTDARAATARAAGPAGRGRRRPRRTPRAARRRPAVRGRGRPTAAGPAARRSPLRRTRPPRAGPREGVALLHVAGPRFGRGLADPDEPITARELQDRMQADVTQLDRRGVPAPTCWWSAATHRVRAAAAAGRGAGVPRRACGSRSASTRIGWSSSPAGGDVSALGLRGVLPRLRGPRTHAGRALLPQAGSCGPSSSPTSTTASKGRCSTHAQPWTLFAVPELRVAVAGLNSTMAMTHRARRRPRADRGGAGVLVRPAAPAVRGGGLAAGRRRPARPVAGHLRGAHDPATLRDAATLDGLLGDRLNLLLHGPGPGGTSAELLGGRLPVLPAADRAARRSST